MTDSDRTDEEIIQLFFERDEQAIRHTDIRYGKDILELSFRMLKQEEDAEENQNDTYFEAWKLIPPTWPDCFRAFLLKICRNKALSKIQKRRTAKRMAVLVPLSDELEMCIPDNRFEEMADLNYLTSSIERFLDSISREDRVMLLRRFWYMESVKDIAADYGITEGNLSTRLWRLKTKLKHHLESEGIQIE